jgi:hypothetical protein
LASFHAVADPERIVRDLEARMRNFGIHSVPNGTETTASAHPRHTPHDAVVYFQSRRQHVRGLDHAGAAHGLNTQAKPLFPFPPGSVRDDPARALLETPNLGGALLDVTMSFVTAFGFVIAVLLLLFF